MHEAYEVHGAFSIPEQGSELDVLMAPRAQLCQLVLLALPIQTGRQPYSELQTHRETMGRFGSGLKPLLAALQRL